MECVYCGSSKLRMSRYRMSDMASLLLLKRPYRCRTCNGRMYLSVFAGLRNLFGNKKGGDGETL
jgi:hypothetical protein